MNFNVNCERCRVPFKKGDVYNYRGNNLCEDCYVLLYLFDREAPDVYLPDKVQLRPKIPVAVGRRLSTKG